MQRHVLAQLATVTFLVLTLCAPCTAASPDGSNGHTVKLNGMEMYYEEQGAGDALILLHSGTQTTRMWDPFVAQFSTDHRVIAVDLRGHGGSTNLDNLWTTRQFAADVFALLDHLGIDRFSAIGASAGAMTLLQMAIQDPERVERMIVIGVGTYIPTPCRKILAPTTADGLSEAGWARLRSQHHHGDVQIRALYAWVASLATNLDDMSFTPPALATITAPTLVVHGDRDYCFPASMAWDIYQAIPQAYLWVVPNGGHVPIQGSFAAPFAETAKVYLSGEWDTTR